MNEPISASASDLAAALGTFLSAVHHDGKGVRAAIAGHPPLLGDGRLWSDRNCPAPAPSMADAAAEEDPDPAAALNEGNDDPPAGSGPSSAASFKASSDTSSKPSSRLAEVDPDPAVASSKNVCGHAG